MESKKRGRPKKSTSRVYQYRIRLSESEREILEFISNDTGLPKSTILRASLQLYYAMKYKQTVKNS